MKIVHIIPFFTPAWGFGGPVRVCYDLSREFIKKGNVVTVLTTDVYDHTKRIDKACEEINGIKVIRFRNVSSSLAKGYNLFFPKGFKNYFSKHVNDYDIVHLHAFFTILNAIAAPICLKNKIPYVLHLHESPIPQKILGKVPLKIIFNVIWGKRILNGAKTIIVPTSKEKESLSLRFPNLHKKIEVIPNAITGLKIKNLNKAELRKKYGFQKEDKIVLSLSRLSQIKRIDRALRIFSKIKDPDFKLLIVGPDEGGTRKRLERLSNKLWLQENVIFWGETAGKEKDDLYLLSDLYLLLSEYESFSMTCLEAIQHGLPLCLSKTVGVARDLFRYHCGIYITDPDNSSKSAFQLAKAYNNKRELAENSRIALKQFDITTITNQLEIIYTKNIK